VAKRVPFETAEVYFGEWIVTIRLAPKILYVYHSMDDYVNQKPAKILEYKFAFRARDWADNVATNGVMHPYDE
jgi:hypothetical protein